MPLGISFALYQAMTYGNNNNNWNLYSAFLDTQRRFTGYGICHRKGESQ